MTSNTLNNLPKELGFNGDGSVRTGSEWYCPLTKKLFRIKSEVPDREKPAYCVALYEDESSTTYPSVNALKRGTYTLHRVPGLDDKGHIIEGSLWESKCATYRVVGRNGAIVRYRPSDGSGVVSEIHEAQFFHDCVFISDGDAVRTPQPGDHWRWKDHSNTLDADRVVVLTREKDTVEYKYFTNFPPGMFKKRVADFNAQAEYMHAGGEPTEELAPKKGEIWRARGGFSFVTIDEVGRTQLLIRGAEGKRRQESVDAFVVKYLRVLPRAPRVGDTWLVNGSPWKIDSVSATHVTYSAKDGSGCGCCPLHDFYGMVPQLEDAEETAETKQAQDDKSSWDKRLAKMVKIARQAPGELYQKANGVELEGALAAARMYRCEALAADRRDQELLVEEKAFDEGRIVHKEQVAACGPSDRRLWEMRGLHEFVHYKDQLPGWYWCDR